MALMMRFGFSGGQESEVGEACDAGVVGDDGDAEDADEGSRPFRAPGVQLATRETGECKGDKKISVTASALNVTNNAGGSGQRQRPNIS